MTVFAKAKFAEKNKFAGDAEVSSVCMEENRFAEWMLKMKFGMTVFAKAKSAGKIKLQEMLK